MKRMFGMMPSSEVEIEKRFKDMSDLKITIQAGPHGWTIIFADSSAKYGDCDNSSDVNFEVAKEIATEILGELVEVGH